MVDPAGADRLLGGKRILLGVSGGIAAYKACELTRLLVKAGARVEVMMTAAAQGFVTAQTFQALSGRPVITAFGDAAGAMAHIAATREADLFVIAPATANVLAKYAHGLADDVLSAAVLARPAALPLLLAPAMNVEMWQAAPTQANVASLQAAGVSFAGPASGLQACGEEGAGRMLEAAQLLAVIKARLSAPLLRGRKVVITAGPSFEALDPVRGITNRSSGKMGYALARACYEAGAEVHLVSGPVALEAPFGIHRHSVESAEEMLAAVEAQLPGCDLFAAVAAVADWRPSEVASHKLKKGGDGLTALTWRENPDIAAWVGSYARQRQGRPYTLGFSAETDHATMLATASAKRQRKGLDAICLNDAKAALGSDHNQLVVIDALGAQALPHASKEVLAAMLVEWLAARLPARL